MIRPDKDFPGKNGITMSWLADTAKWILRRKYGSGVEILQGKNGLFQKEVQRITTKQPVMALPRIWIYRVNNEGQ